MGFKKRTPRILESARTRASGIAGFDPNLDLGGGLSLAKLKEAADKVETSLDSYNQTLSLADQQANALEADEAALNDLNSRILSGVGARHGANSNQ